MDQIIIFFRAFVAVLLVFAGGVALVRILAKKLRSLRARALPSSEKRREGIIGLLLVLVLLLAIPPIGYCIARSVDGAEAVVIVSGLISIPFLFFARKALWHSVCLCATNDRISGGTLKMEHTTCPMPDANPADAEITEILQAAKTIAVVGLSDNPEKDSNRVARYLIEKGYHVIPVNPGKKEILERTCYPDLSSVPEKIDVVDIFRPVEAIPPVVDEAIKVGAKVIWMQLGLAHPESAQKARAAGLKVVQGKCIKVEHSKLFGGGAGITFNLG